MIKKSLIAALTLFVSSAFANADTLELKTCMDTHYGAGLWSYYTVGTAGSGTDIEPALHDCFTTLQGSGNKRGIIHVGTGGIWALATAIPAADLSGQYLVGDGSQASKIVVQLSSGTAFTWTGVNSLTGGGMRGIGVLLDSNLGTTTTYAIAMSGTSTTQADQTEFDDLYITSLGATSYWYRCINADGTARTSPQGIRISSWNNVQCFNSSSAAAIYLSNVVGWSMRNIGAYTPKSGTSGADMYITGGGTASTNSTEVTADRLNIGGNLNLSNASSIQVDGNAASTVISSTLTYASGVMVGGVSGTGGTGTSHLIGP